MAILAALFAAVGRQAGRVLTTALGWASALLFGRVPRHKQLLLSLIALGSLLWVVLVLGIILPWWRPWGPRRAPFGRRLSAGPARCSSDVFPDTSSCSCREP